MNQETNNEIDLMLRKLGRQGVDASINSPDEHLDADELNMYSENVLTPNTRARYTEHLADCTRCRQAVSQLTMAAGLVVQEKKTEAPTPTGIKGLLASFFSPMVLRYAVPALGLVIVASIGFIVLRDSGLNKQALSSDVQTSIAKNEPVAAKQPLDGSGYLNSNEASGRNTVEKAQTNDPKAASSPAASNADDTPKELADRKSDEPAKATDQVAAAPATAGAYATATPVPKPAADERTQAAVDVAEKKKQSAEESSTTGEAAKTEAKAEEQRKLGAANLARSEPVAKRNAPPSSVQQRARENEADEGGRRADKDQAETRSVAGRQFRRDGSTWIDTAYSSQSTTIVARGSEQYRALVADEPAIKTIADQLSGEVILVWKGRAYRIR